MRKETRWWLFYISHYTITREIGDQLLGHVAELEVAERHMGLGESKNL